MIADWTSHTFSLFDEISRWCSEIGWRTESELEYRDLPNSKEQMEVYGLRVITPAGRIHLEPLGQRSDGSVIIEMYAWPTLLRVRLVEKPGDGQWQVVTDSGIPFHYDWTKENFVRLVHDLQVLP